jgi:lysophospholipase L1-like esterase
LQANFFLIYEVPVFANENLPLKSVLNNRMKKYWRTIFVVIVLLALLEGTARIVLSKIYNRDFDSSLIVDNKYFTSSGLKANATGYVWGKPFHTDSFACRKNPKPFSGKKKKWLFIGDSVTEGVGVDDSSTFAALVAAREDSVNIMNYSLIGYSDADYLNVLKTLLSAKDSSVIKATIFFCLNDVYGSAKTNQLPVMAKQNLMGSVNKWMQANYSTYKLVKLLTYSMSDRYFKYDVQFYTKGNPFFTESMQRLKECDSICSLSGVKMNVLMLPYRSQLTGQDLNEMPQTMVRYFCLQNDIVFDAITSSTALISDPVSGDFLYLFADEIHFSVAGHKMVANYILSH